MPAGWVKPAGESAKPWRMVGFTHPTQMPIDCLRREIAAGRCAMSATDQTWNELPQPQDFTTLGLLNTKPRFSRPS